MPHFLAPVFHFEKLHMQLRELGWAVGAFTYGGEMGAQSCVTTVPQRSYVMDR